MTEPLKLATYTTSVRVKDGQMLCPCHGEPMVEAQPDVWGCPIWTPIWQAVLAWGSDAVEESP